MARIRRIGVLFLAKMLGILMASVGLIAGILYSFGGAIYELFTSSLNSGTALAFLALLGMPAIFGAVGFLVGTVAATIYNLFARWFGGIELDFQTDS